MNKASKLINIIELGIKGGSIDGFEQKIKELQIKFKDTPAGEVVDSNIDSLLVSSDQINSLLAIRAALVSGMQRLREPSAIESYNNLISEIDSIIRK